MKTLAHRLQNCGAPDAGDNSLGCEPRPTMNLTKTIHTSSV